MKNILIGIINVYQKLPLSTHSKCKYIPTCSMYTKQAIIEYGSIKGSIMGLKRILRCNPLSKGGIDPVPRKGDKNEKS